MIYLLSLWLAFNASSKIEPYTYELRLQITEKTSHKIDKKICELFELLEKDEYGFVVKKNPMSKFKGYDWEKNGEVNIIGEPK